MGIDAVLQNNNMDNFNVFWFDDKGKEEAWCKAYNLVSKGIEHMGKK